MTDLEIMQHAKEYLDKLARGIDPLTGREVPEGEVFTGKTNSVQTVRKSCRDVRSFFNSPLLASVQQLCAVNVYFNGFPAPLVLYL